MSILCVAMVVGIQFDVNVAASTPTFRIVEAKVPPVREVKVKVCPCSEQCTCGCNESRPCRCRVLTPFEGITIINESRPVQKPSVAPIRRNFSVPSRGRGGNC